MIQRNIVADETVKAVVIPVTTEMSPTPFSASPMEDTISEYEDPDVYALWAERSSNDGVCGAVGY